METLVLCPEELCLGPIRLTASGLVGLSPVVSDFSIWTNCDVEKGTRFLPWKGTVRGDKLPVYDKLPDFDVRHRFGLYDEISDSPTGCRLRQCNWIRFLRYSLVYNEEVNVVATKGPTGEPVFDLVKDVGPKTELVAFFVPERPEEAFLLPAIQYLRHTLFKRLVDNVLEESPLDLSNSLVMSKVFPAAVAAAAAAVPSPAHSIEGRKSVSSDCTTCTETSETSTSASMAVSVAERHRGAGLTSTFSTTTSRISSRESTTTTTSMASASSLTSPSSASLSSSRRREKNMLPCHYCGKAFDRPSLLKRHVRIHTGERPHVCDVCSKGFSTSSSLNTHRRIHSGEKPHQCGVCGKRFTASSNLYYHKMTHIKEKPHKCTMCSKSFPTPGDLKSHTYVHTGTWPFKCHICHRGFSKQTNLKNHLLLHSGDKPFSCEICQKKFALSCNLRAHLKTHEAEFQSSAASLELYKRALASLAAHESSSSTEDLREVGSSSPAMSPINENDSPAEEEEEEEELDEEDEESSQHDHLSGDEEVALAAKQSSRRSRGLGYAETKHVALIV